MIGTLGQPSRPPRSLRRGCCCGDDLTSIGEVFIFQMLEPSPHLPQEVSLSDRLEGRQTPARPPNVLCTERRCPPSLVRLGGG
jgi:hypothetical protein